MKIYYFWGLIFIFIIIACGKDQQSTEIPIEIPELEHLAINVAPDQSRPLVFTNKASAFFYGETGKIREDGHQGFNVQAKKYFDDYLLTVDNQYLERKNADSIKVYPDHIARFYEEGLTENLYLLDYLNCLVIELKSPDLHSYDFIPLLPTSLDLSHYKVQWQRNQNLLILSPKEQTPDNDKTVVSQVLGFQFDCTTQFYSQVKSMPDSLIPSNQVGQFRIVKDNCRIFLVVAEDEDELKRVAKRAINNFIQLVDEKKRRLIKLLGDCHFETDQPDLNKAYRWAVISMDQLIMKQSGAGKQVTGIFAGLPWFNNYWGRDTFISLPGAVLVRGRFEDAREILLSYAQFQNDNPADSNYGRIPNQVTTDNIIYNTADGTPWFIRELWEYYQYSGDREILETLYPVVKRAVEGTFKYHTDQFYFLTHEDAETWMDASGTDGPWSPRSNRAVEVQALWYQQLIASSRIAKLLDKNKQADDWLQIAGQLKQNFQDNFWNNQRFSLFDHLNANNSPDEKIRPNQLFAITVPDEPLLKPEHEFMLLKEVTTYLTYPYGVSSLWQHDPDFHPFHILPKYYPKDAAYHNGIVWGWLAGPVVSSLMKYGYQNLAYEILVSESDQILNVGAVGTLSELLDAIPPPGAAIPNPSGTVSQAWSLAEYLRNIFQDLIGIHPNVPEKRITISPHLSDEINSLTCCVPVPESNLHLSMQQNEIQFNLELNYINGDQPWNIDVHYLLSPTEIVLFTFPIQKEEARRVQIQLQSPPIVLLDGNEIGYRFEKLPIRDELITYFSFAAPQLDKNLNYLKPPPYPLLSGSQIKTWNDRARKLIDVDAPKFDDKGPNKKYVYPTNPHFKDGILDLTKFQLFEDSKNYYFRLQFRNMVQPGWHPEFGFQLTYVAIAIDQKTGKPGASIVSRNANLRLPQNMAFHRILFIGGGLQIEDNDDKILAAYRSDDPRFPLGDVTNREIAFAIPKEYIGNYKENWKFILMVGAQDDHGGGGIGEFRDVGKVASQWQGGGGERETGNCNVYDLFVVK